MSDISGVGQPQNPAGEKPVLMIRRKKSTQWRKSSVTEAQVVEAVQRYGGLRQAAEAIDPVTGIKVLPVGYIQVWRFYSAYEKRVMEEGVSAETPYTDMPTAIQQRAAAPELHSSALKPRRLRKVS